MREAVGEGTKTVQYRKRGWAEALADEYYDWYTLQYALPELIFHDFWCQVAIAALIRELEKSHEFIDYESSWWVI